MRYAAAIAVLLASVLTVRAARAEPGGHLRVVTPERRITEERRFVLEAGETRVEIGRSFIVPESDSLFVNGVPLPRGDGYRINPLRGSVVLVRPASSGDTLTVRFARYPFPFPPVFAARFPEGEQPPPEAAIAVGSAGKAGGSGPEPYRLRFSGSKTVGFSVGSDRGLGIDQSLKVTMMGTIARDLEVKAFLTDDNLPVQPEGNTEELKYIDKVAIEIRSRHAEVKLGDFSTGLSWSRFSSFERELRGAAVTVGVKGQRYTAGGGIAKGRFRTASFRGREGVQGPYELLPAQRLNGVIVLPGTETVYLDGRLLTRGSEKDYTIDYVRGSVTFTERVPVTADAEIAIDFQIGEDTYERTTLLAGWEGPLAGESLKLRASFFQEADDAGRPLRGGLSDEERSLIESAGDDPSRAVAGGIEHVEAGRGNYRLVPADSLPQRFVFVESGGDYVLDFLAVGAGKGDYRTDGFSRRGEVKYAYAGAGLGSYVIGRQLPLPERDRLFTIGAEGKRGHVFLGVEGNLSLHDKNILSGLDDGDNDGHAVMIVGGLRDVPVSTSRLSIVGEFSELDDRFTAPDKPRDSYFYRNWGLEDVPLVGRERIGGGTIHWREEKRWDLAGGYHVLSRDQGPSARKGDAAIEIGDVLSRGLRLGAFDSKADGGRIRRFAGGEGAFALWHLVPRVAAEAERYRAFSETAPDTGRQYYQSTVALAGRGIGDFRGSASYTARLTDQFGGAHDDWYRARENDELSLEGGYSRGERIYDLVFTHLTSRDVVGGATSWNDLARLRYRDSWDAAGVTSDVGYRISAGVERRIEKAVVFVGENEGDYDEEGNEVGQKRGDYMVLYLPGGDTEKINSVELSWNLSIGGGVRSLTGPSPGGGWTSWVRRNVSCDQFVSVVEKSRTGELLRLYTLSPSLLQRDDVTLYGSTKLRQEWSFLNDVRSWNLRAVYSREDEEDNRTEGLSAERFTREVQVRVEAVPKAPLTLSLEAGTTLRRRDSGSRSGQNYLVRTLSVAQELSYRLRPSTRLAFELGYEDRTDEVSSAGQSSYSATPTFTSSVGAKLHVTAFLKFTYTAVDSDIRKPLFFLEEGMREDWSLNGQYRVTGNVSFGVNYTGRREKDFRGEVKTVHALKVESRAYF